MHIVAIEDRLRPCFDSCPALNGPRGPSKQHVIGKVVKPCLTIGLLADLPTHFSLMSVSKRKPDIATSINLAAFEAHLFVCAVAKWFVRGFPAAT
jgi:hypothetical protein